MSKARRTSHSLADLVDDAPPTVEPAANTTSPTTRASKQKSKAFNIFVTAEDHKRLKSLSVSLEGSMQDLGREALNLLLRKHGLPGLDPAARAPSMGSRKGD